MVNTSQFKFQVDRNEEIDQQMIAEAFTGKREDGCADSSAPGSYGRPALHFNSVPVVVNRRGLGVAIRRPAFSHPEGFKPGLVDMERFDLFDDPF